MSLIAVDLSGTENLPEPEALSTAAAGIAEQTDQMAQTLNDAQDKWRTITDYYRAPEQQVVFSAMDKPSDHGEAIGRVAASARNALEEFADAVRTIKAKRAILDAEVGAAKVADRARENLTPGFVPDFIADFVDEKSDALVSALLQRQADALAADLQAAEETCRTALRALRRRTSDVLPAAAANENEYAASDATRALNKVLNGDDGPDAMRQLLAALALLTPSQAAQFKQSNPELFSGPHPGLDPRSNKEAWSRLAAAQRQSLAKQFPLMVGNLEGIPYSDRTAANAVALEAALVDAEGERRDALLAIQAGAKSAPGAAPRGIISLDLSSPPLAAVAIGNMDTADNVTWNVPGMGTSWKEDESWTDASQNIYDAQGKLGEHNQAVVAWIGYETPPQLSLGHTEVLDTAHARAGGEKFATALNGFHAASGNRDPYIAVAAHSYGTTTSAYGLTQTDFDVDSVTFFGSAGLDQAVVDNAADLNIKPASDGTPALFATNAPQDIVAPSGGYFGYRINPLEEGFGAHEFSSKGDPARDLVATRGHSVNGSGDTNLDPFGTQKGHGYLDIRTHSLDSVARATTGRGDSVLKRDRQIFPPLHDPEEMAEYL
ncbi:alpha/beta hydrolase family protein [Arthrobacter sp. zg-Y40]|uniref:alpha/beta hydrolase n=1 Tax=Arthrobacter sp. zg-Y40 TaxID=2886939 RepID=UPI001D15209C|nr:alpha/beta hydrolase [Arthrobacter sp. zg-Y40]MCC3279823.1 alpha/beta hydrolase family protein [Arthrobacter sp. zg-Y40]